jgi:hypothetical protein
VLLPTKQRWPTPGPFLYSCWHEKSQRKNKTLVKRKIGKTTFFFTYIPPPPPVLRIRIHFKRRGRESSASSWSIWNGYRPNGETSSIPTRGGKKVYIFCSSYLVILFFGSPSFFGRLDMYMYVYTCVPVAVWDALLRSPLTTLSHLVGSPVGCAAGREPGP